MARLTLWFLLGLTLLAVSFNDVRADVGPSESECRPYIEKAINELKTSETPEAADKDADVQSSDTTSTEDDTTNNESGTDSGEMQSDQPTPDTLETVEITDVDSNEDNKSAEKPSSELDSDGDGVPDSADEAANGEDATEEEKQESNKGTEGDLDGDGIPDSEDDDIDGDGIPNDQDDDIDGDGIPNDQDDDIDGDGIPNDQDDDIDGDGIPNDQDDDIDGDGIPNDQDNDIDGDGIPNDQDNDIDGDGIPNDQDDDNRTQQTEESKEEGKNNGKEGDLDGDGIPDSEDDDIDGDGIPNDQDDDIDGDGIPNDQDDDIDGDGIPNDQDDDIDGDGIPNDQDNDIDGDGIPNDQDDDIDGDGIPNDQDDDIDGDGIPNDQDDDIDGDGIPNDQDKDVDGDGIPNDQDNDVDGDGIPNEQENQKQGTEDSVEEIIEKEKEELNEESNKKADLDGDGIPDHEDDDIDGDGIPNTQDDDHNVQEAVESEEETAEGETQNAPAGDEKEDQSNEENNEKKGDLDGDGIADHEDEDMDGDLIPNEKDPDMDGDSIPNEKDPDMDGDSIPNEHDPDIDGDSIPNEKDPDVDGDSIPNETDPDIDGDLIPNEQDPDKDGDGIPNEQDNDDIEETVERVKRQVETHNPPTGDVEEESNNEENSKEQEDNSGDDADTEEDTKPEDELLWEGEIPENLRSRDHITELLQLNEEFNAREKAVDNVAEIILRDIKKTYENAVKPLETLYKYRDLSNRHFSDPEIFSKPLILFMGPWSGGKSTIINYLTNNEYTANSLRTGAEPSPAYFNILMWGNETEVLDGTQLAADYTFSGLQKFGEGLEERLRGLKLPNKLLEKVNIVEIPGILEVRKQVSRVFPFNDACQWFIDRADIIFLVYDPAKLDVGPETEAILDQLKGREYQTRIVLNKADTVKPEELLRVQSALIWNISPLMSSAQPPLMYTTSLWSHPYQEGAPARLLLAQERAFLRDLRTAIEKRIEHKIASARRFAVRVRNHAKMVDCYLNTYTNHKTLFGNKKRIADEIINHPQNYHIYEGLSTLTNISRYDLPDPEVYRDFFRLNPLYEFKKLSQTCTYFRGCPISKLDVAIAYDLPELAGKYRRMSEAALAKIEAQDDADAGGSDGGQTQSKKTKS